MSLLPGIQTASGFSRNTAAPLDVKTMLTTAQRLGLDLVQRWPGMIVYDTDLGIWKKLVTNPAGDITTETNWLSFTGGIIEITHTDLKALQDSGNLAKGQNYETTDTATKYTQPITNIIKTKPVEPLIHTALSNNKLSKNIKSKLYPEDIIHYNINDVVVEGTPNQYIEEDEVGSTSDNVSGYNGITGWDKEDVTILYFYCPDLSSYIYAYDNITDRDSHNTSLAIFYCPQGSPGTIVEQNGSGFGGTLTVGTLTGGDEFYVTYVSLSRKGRIYFRKDTLTGNSTGFDFRNLYYARAKCNHALYVPATIYAERDMVRIASDGIYISVENANIGNNPQTSPNKWWRILDLSVTEYLGWDTNCNGISFDMTDTIEVPTFWILGEETNTSGIIIGDGIYGGIPGIGFKKYVIESGKRTDAEVEMWGISASLYNYSNTVFYIMPTEEDEFFLGNICIKSGSIIETGTITGNNTLNIKHNEFHNNTEIDVLKNNIGNIAMNVSKLNNVIDNVFHHSSIRFSHINKINNCIIGGDIKESNINVLENVILRGSIWKVKFNSINDIICDNIRYISGFETKLPASGYLNLKDATHIQSFAYSKNWFIDFGGTHKISYINALNTIVYALPTD